MSFNMEEFLTDLRQSHGLTGMELLAATLHHCWEDHPLKIETSINLVALTPHLALDMGDVQYIHRDHTGDFLVVFKSNGSILIHSDTPEFEALEAVMATLNNEH